MCRCSSRVLCTFTRWRQGMAWDNFLWALFVVFNPCELLANRDDFGLFLLRQFSNFTSPPQRCRKLQHVLNDESVEMVEVSLRLSRLLFAQTIAQVWRRGETIRVIRRNLQRFRLASLLHPLQQKQWFFFISPLSPFAFLIHLELPESA